MTVQLPELPYAYDALEPVISATTLKLHHDKHHRAYVDKANALASRTQYESMPVEQIIVQTISKRSSRTLARLFDNAAQAWNHSFYWQSMRPSGGGLPTGKLAARIESDFRGLENFLTRFGEAATQNFGSGWTWLILDRGKLRICSTSNADTPIARGLTPLLTCDVWEHAYYLDHQNRRAEYVNGFLRSLANWDFAAANLEHAQLRLAAE
jgi:Fe-Mn family superoxide dismutase